MSGLGVLVDVLLDHPDAGVILLLALYLGYEIRFGRLNDVQREQREASKERRILGIALYKVVRDDPNYNEGEFRELLWGDEEMFPRDLLADEAMERQRGDTD